MTALALLTGAILIATGIIWRRREGVSAERPASLIIAGGVGVCTAPWWLPWLLS
jgi:hypothetical protein